MGLIDARPLIPRDSDNIWHKAAVARDRVYSDFLQISRDQQIDALVLKTNPAVYPPEVRFEAWLPTREDSITERCEVTVSIEPKPFYQYELEFSLSISDRGRSKHIRRLHNFSKEAVESLVLHLLRKGPEPRYLNIRIRRFPGQFWLPKNEIVCINFAWINYFPAISIFVTAGILWGSAVFYKPVAPEVWLVTIGLFFLTGGCWIWFLKGFRLFKSSGKPLTEPRTLIRVDTWQTIIFGAGADSKLFHDRLSKALETPPTEHFRYSVEQHWDWGLDGKEERDQIVLSFKRGILFCQIHQYGDGLYIGWEAHFNIGQWVEEKVAHGLDADTGKLTTICTVVPGLQMVTRYDLADLNCLIEWTHGHITQLIKRFVAEKQIEQEFDFKILRGNREGPLSWEGRGKAQAESASWNTLSGKFDTKSVWIGTRSGS